MHFFAFQTLKSDQKILVLRCLRPDRVTMAMATYVREQMG
eukprot:COSAG05_NODE_2608_length_2842_cov_1.550128_2_plen_39_part_01